MKRNHLGFYIKPFYIYSGPEHPHSSPPVTSKPKRWKSPREVEYPEGSAAYHCLAPVHCYNLSLSSSTASLFWDSNFELIKSLLIRSARTQHSKQSTQMQMGGGRQVEENYATATVGDVEGRACKSRACLVIPWPLHRSLQNATCQIAVNTFIHI